MGTCPYAGLSPTTPQCAAGVRTLQPVSVPSANGTYPAATAPADPEDDPPVIRVGSWGLWAGPDAEASPVGPCANSWVCSLATTTAPAARSRATAAASAVAGGASANTFEPHLVGSPATSNKSFTPSATPCSGPRHRPWASSSVSAAACARARSASRVTTRLYGSAASRSRASLTCSVGESSPDRMAMPRERRSFTGGVYLRRASSASAAYSAAPAAIADSSNATRLLWFGGAVAGSTFGGHAPRNASAPGTFCST